MTVKFGTLMPIHGARAVLVLVYERAPVPLSRMLDNLLSKVIAAGLAAGVFLLWWPAHLPSTGVQWLVLRGLAWTLAFEVLALSFVPLEQMATRAVTRRRSAGRAHRVRSRLAAAPAPARASGAVMLAFTGLLLPVLLLLHTGHLPAQPTAHTTQVVRKVVVRKVVHEKTVVVREAAQAPAPAVVSAPPVTPAAAAQAPAKKTATKQATPSTTSAAKKATTVPKTTVTAPADPATLPNPAEPAAPAADAAAPADVPAG
jgi:hypothetical protein